MYIYVFFTVHLSIIHTKYFFRHGEIVEHQPGEEKIPVKDEQEVTEEQPFIACMMVKMEHPLDESLTMKEEESQQIKGEPCIEDHQPLAAQESASEGYKVRRPERVEEQMDGRRKKPHSR
jgi:hypothetical protein